MESAVAAIIALALSLKFSDLKIKKAEEELASLREQLELVEQERSAHDQETLKKVMTTILPVAKAVQRLNQEVGIQ